MIYANYSDCLYFGFFSRSFCFYCRFYTSFTSHFYGALRLAKSEKAKKLFNTRSNPRAMKTMRLNGGGWLCCVLLTAYVSTLSTPIKLIRELRFFFWCVTQKCRMKARQKDCRLIISCGWAYFRAFRLASKVEMFVARLCLQREWLVGQRYKAETFTLSRSPFANSISTRSNSSGMKMWSFPRVCLREHIKKALNLMVPRVISPSSAAAFRICLLLGYFFFVLLLLRNPILI